MDLTTVIFSIVGVIGTGVSIYQWAILNESKKRRKELQFLFAGIHQMALSKQLEWNNQINFLPSPEDEKDFEIIRIHTRARDNLMEIGNAITAFENVIDTESSALESMMKKTIKQSELNNELQNIGSKNPILKTT